MKNVEHALLYLEAGASVIPVSSDKEPLIRWKAFQTRAPSAREVAMWFRRWPLAGVAIVCGAVSRVCVLDVEQEAIPELLDLTVPDTLTVRTQGGGLHYYFKYEASLRSTNWTRHGMHCGELRSDGNYVLAPPSRGPDGEYSWLHGPGGVELADAPVWLHELPRSARQTPTGRTTRASAPSRSEEDQQLALAMVLAGEAPDAVLSCLRARPASWDRSDSEDYCKRTLHSARHFAEKHYHCARIVRVSNDKYRAGLCFRITTGCHAGRTLRRWLDWPATGRSQQIWSSLATLSGAAVLKPGDLLGLELRVGVFERNDGLAVGGLAYPLSKPALGDESHDEPT